MGGVNRPPSARRGATARAIGLIVALTVPFAAPLAPALAQGGGSSPRRTGVEAEARNQPDVQAALAWLVAQQGADGSWGQANKLSLTGMAGMALLASGSTPQRGPYAQELQRAILFVLQSQQADRKAFQHPSSGYSAIHNHGYALLFLTQAYGEGGPLDDQLRFAITQGVKATIDSQFTGGGSDGGFGYFLYKRVVAKHRDMWQVDEASTTISQIQALRGARNAGFTVDRNALEGRAATSPTPSTSRPAASTTRSGARRPG